MSTISSSTNYSATRDDIIKRALRIIGAIGQGETPSTDAYTEASQALNDVVKEWEADGMQLWKYNLSSAITVTAGTSVYTIGISSTINQQAPLKIVQAFFRNNSTNNDRPINLVTQQEYQMLGNKSVQTSPNQLWYKPPGPPSTEMIGTITLYPTPDTNCATNEKLYVVGMYPLDDFDASTDLADFPSFYYNALVWGLADQLSYEYGVPFAQQSMITKKAEIHLQKALGYDREEGSLYLQPDWQGRNW
jgi:hypothetical protein